jgi:hypothetical protein
MLTFNWNFKKIKIKMSLKKINIDELDDQITGHFCEL